MGQWQENNLLLPFPAAFAAGPAGVGDPRNSGESHHKPRGEWDAPREGGDGAICSFHLLRSRLSCQRQLGSVSLQFLESLFVICLDYCLREPRNLRILQFNPRERALPLC
ncbi:hypothetical protein BRADI_5g14015v3 [Brachypodium distachyon]|uniref:Uncharacterized protein n=1 Tax=Brachypodium distachyon TaxID=15368 RepID=A0A2K2CH43_BRADI|nr:hypothetical protein BRADI_5g14015v3 [Brachypodium distachyon]